MRILTRLLALLLAIALIAGAVLLSIEVVVAALGKAPLILKWHGLYDDGVRDAWSDTMPITVSVLLVVVGALLVLTQLAPRRPRELALVTADADLEATLGVAGLRRSLLAAAAEVNGVATATGRVRARRARVRARSMGDQQLTDDLRPRVEEAVGERLTLLGLSRPPRLQVRVRAGEKG